MTKWPLYTLVLAALLCLTVGWLVATESGLRATWRVTTPLLHSWADIDLQAKDIEGRLLGPLIAHELHYRDAYVEVQTDEVRIQWRPEQLLSGRIQLTKAEADNLRVSLLTPEASTSELAAPDTALPITVHIDEANVDKLLFRLDTQSEAWAFSDITADVAVLEDRVTIKQLSASAYDIHGKASGFISWQGRFPMALDTSLSQPLPDAAPLLSQVEATGDMQNFALTLSTAAPYSGELQMQWQAVADGYAMSLKGPFEPAPLLVAMEQLPPEALSTGPLSIDTEGLLTTTGFKASTLQLTHGKSQLQASGQLDWSGDSLNWAADCQWQNLSLPPWAPQLHSANGQAKVHGDLEQGEAYIDAAYAIEDQQPGAAKLLVVWQGATVELKQGELAADRSRVAASGNLWPRAKMSWTANSPNLGELWPAASGSIKGNGTINGSWLAPRVQGDLQASKLSIAGLQVDKLGLKADLDLEKDSQGFFNLNAAGLRLSDSAPANFQLNATGKRSAQQLSLSISSPKISATAKAQGGWAGGSAAWTGQLQQLAIDPPQTGAWVLQAPVAIQAHINQVTIGNTCLIKSKAKLCLLGSKQAEEWAARAELEGMPLSLLSTWLPDALDIRGTVNAKAQISGAAGQWQAMSLTGKAKAQLARTDIEDRLDLQLHGLSLIANPQRWHTELELQINESGQLSLEAVAEPQSPDLSLVTWQTAKLRGNLQLDMQKLQELALIAPEIEQLRGQIKGDIQASGSLGKPIFGGRVALTEGRLDLRDYGISLSPLTATVIGKPDGSLALEMSAISGEGILRLLGQTRVDLQKPSLSASIKGERFLAIRTDEATVFISPDLQLAVQDRRVELTGELRIPQARLQPGEQAVATQTVSDDQLLISDAGIQPREPLWTLMARVRLILGEKVLFKGMGVETGLTGQLDLRENPGKPTIANGEIRLTDGFYEVYGQKLDIDTGRLIFANAPITQPAIDLKASRMPRQNIKVGVKVRGLLDTPEVTLFSTPSMRQAEQLSYLILGRPLEGNEGNPTLAGAALALGLGRGDKYLKGLSNSLNVDQIGIETTPGEASTQASLVVGKYLSPRLYVSYGAGLFEPLHKLRMRYRMSEHWTLTGESGTSQGADILYTIER